MKRENKTKKIKIKSKMYGNEYALKKKFRMNAGSS